MYGSPSTNPMPVTLTPHGLYPVWRPMLTSTSYTLTHFGKKWIICPPPLAPAAMLSWLVRHESTGIEFGGELRTRAQIDANPNPRPWPVPALEDFEEWAQASTRCVERIKYPGSISFEDEDEDDRAQELELEKQTRRYRDEWWRGDPPPGGSMRFEHEWQRMTRCFNPYLDAALKIRPYQLGMLTGTWEGRMVVSVFFALWFFLEIFSFSVSIGFAFFLPLILRTHYFFSISFLSALT